MASTPLEFDLVAAPEPNLVPKLSAKGSASMNAFKSGFFDREKVKQAMDEATYVALLKSGAWVRTVARRSMRYRNAPSRPGEPPSARQGPANSLLRRMLYFAYDFQSQEVVVGPVRLGRESDVPKLHEFGGIQRAISLGERDRTVRYGDNRLGATGPIRLVSLDNLKIGPSTKLAHNDPLGRIVVYARLRTPEQVAEANRIEEEIYTFKNRRFPKRPYMRPALAQSTDKITSFWENSLGVKRRVTV